MLYLWRVNAKRLSFSFVVNWMKRKHANLFIDAVARKLRLKKVYRKMHLKMEKHWNNFLLASHKNRKWRNTILILSALRLNKTWALLKCNTFDRNCSRRLGSDLVYVYVYRLQLEKCRIKWREFKSVLISWSFKISKPSKLNAMSLSLKVEK